jgi:hypothetical protein
MITLFHRSKTRSSRFIFLLEELEAPSELQQVTTKTPSGGAVTFDMPLKRAPATADPLEKLNVQVLPQINAWLAPRVSAPAAH